MNAIIRLYQSIILHLEDIDKVLEAIQSDCQIPIHRKIKFHIIREKNMQIISCLQDGLKSLKGILG